MALGFPLYIDLNGNNCVVFGGGEFAADRAQTLLRFGAKVTVIHPTLCPRLREMDEGGQIRYIPRRYYRGDCTSAYLCVAATDDDALNIAISDECKAKGLPVNVSSPAAFGTFLFPAVVFGDGLTVSVAGGAPAHLERLRDELEKALPSLEEAASKPGGGRLTRMFKEEGTRNTRSLFFIVKTVRCFPADSADCSASCSGTDFAGYDFLRAGTAGGSGSPSGSGPDSSSPFQFPPFYALSVAQSGNDYAKGFSRDILSGGPLSSAVGNPTGGAPHRCPPPRHWRDSANGPPRHPA